MFYGTLLLSLVAVFFTQTNFPQTAPDLEVSDPQWVYDVNRKFNIHSRNGSSNKRSPVTTPVVQEISALFRNTGEKTVAEVGWEFIVYSDEDFDRIKRIYRVRSEKEIAPEETVRLAGTGIFRERSPYRKVNVYRIEYTDGTVWEGDRTKDE